MVLNVIADRIRTGAEVATKPGAHQATQHRLGLAGIEARSICSGHVFPRHAHDQYGIGVITAGAQRSWSLFGAVDAGAGDVIMLNPGEMHDGAPLGPARRWHMVYFAPELLARDLEEEMSPEAIILRPVARDRALSRDIARFFRHLGRGPLEPMAIEERLLAWLARITRRHLVHGPRSSTRTPSVAAAVRRLEEAPDAPVSLAELAACAGISRFQLVRGFRRALGITPHAYLVQLRVRRARQHLMRGAAPAEAALLAGFADQSHLTRAFVKHLGVPPARHRAAIVHA
jgi:AraC-like DNA-binding protein